MVQVLDCLIMVRMGKNRGEDTKMLISQEPSVWFTSNLDRVYMRVCPTTRWHCFCHNDITGCVQVCKMHPRCFPGRKNKERYNLGCSYCVPKWFPGVFPLVGLLKWMSSSYKQFIPPFMLEKFKEARVLYWALPPCCEMRRFTPVYNLEHIYWILNISTSN